MAICLVWDHPDKRNAALQAWQTMHPPKRGPRWRRPRVHIGFHKSWTKNGLNLRVKERVCAILYSGQIDLQHAKLYVTGQIAKQGIFCLAKDGLNPTYVCTQTVLMATSSIFSGLFGWDAV